MKQYKRLTNHEALQLVEQYKQNAQQSVLGELYAPYMKMIYSVGLKYFQEQNSADDLVMKVYEKLGKKLQTNEIKNFSSWLYTVAKNECLMELRKTKKELPTEKIEVYQQNFMESEQAVHLMNDNSGERKISALSQCLEQLKKEQKICIESFYYQNKTYKEIEEETNFDMKKVKSNIQNGKRNLKNCVEQANAKH